MSEVENKVRGTRKLFKEFKSFLTDYLKQINPVVSGENGGHLGHLLQVSDCLRSINQLEPVCCKKRQKKVQTKKLVWAIEALIDPK